MTGIEKVWSCLDEQYKIFIEKIPNLTLEQFEKEVKKSRGYFSPSILRKKIEVKKESFKKAKSSWVAEKKKELKPELTFTLEQENLQLENKAKKLEIEERNLSIKDKREGRDKQRKKDKLAKKMVRSAGYPLFDDEE